MEEGEVAWLYMTSPNMEHPKYPVMYFGPLWAGTPMTQDDGRRIISGKIVGLAALGAAMAASLGVLTGFVVMSGS